jgi:hypothetical protein
MTRLKYLIPAVLAVCSLPVFAQKNPCDLVTQSEASALLGSAVDKKTSPTSCIYKVKGSTVALHVRIEKNKGTAASVTKANLGKSGAVVKDEPSLGAGSYSAVWPSSDRFYMVKGDQMLRIDYADPSGGKIPDGLLEKLRAAAKTALGRL